jgi:predicted alpha-1,2-mannosidase
VALGAPAVDSELAVTTRTGLARFTFPRSDAANLLFKVADNPNPVTGTDVRLVGRDEVAGQVTSGQFCGTGSDYTLYFVARFDRPVSASGTWSGSGVSPGSTACSGTRCGAFVSFDTESRPTVFMKIGISFVSEANAADNLRVEDPGWSLGRVEASATARWNALLGRIRVGGGTPAQQHTFYTALYHSLLGPNVVSDDNGQYDGPDGRRHRVRSGAHYSNFSEWDIYRSQMELVSLLAPGPAGDMIQSLVDDAHEGGWLPKWAIVDGDASQMNGDSADPIIAAAYAFGVRGFDVRAALTAMVKGATQNETGHGLEIERQYLSQYLSQHYIDAGSLDLTSIDYSLGASATLEYAIDDFTIARMAAAQGDHALEQSMMERAHNWEYLFNPSTESIQGRNTDGSFPAGAAFQTSLLEPGGEEGFEEGNAAQYTWSVPQDLSALAELMGGDTATVDALNGFFTDLNASRDAPHDWAGNEPSLWTPWEYDYFGAPSRTQAVVRSIVNTLYGDAPVDEPGNDDLGALSSWYVWAAIGLYPVTPGSADLALASPLFPDVAVTLPDGRRLTVHAPGASASAPYVHSLRLSGVTLPEAGDQCGTARPAGTGEPWCEPWLPASVITTGGTLSYGLSAVPDTAWGSAPAARPPSYGAGRIPAVGYSVPSGAVTVGVGRTATVHLGVQPAEAGRSTVAWVAGGSGLTVSPDSGHLVVGAGSTVPVSVVASGPGTHVLEVHMATAAGKALPPVVIDVDAAD